jgi:UDP-N-acetylmuramyl pentapeptide phosphotransferase/UDP-N-acetylglucosamine-1-phosphate transferase
MRALAFIFVGSFVVVLATTPLVSRLARWFGVVDRPDPRKVHKKPTPRVGGIAILAGVAFALYAALCCVPGLGFGWGAAGAPMHALILSAGVVFATGLVDDLFALPSKAKLVILLVCAAALSGAGVRIEYLGWPGGPVFRLGWGAFPVTTVWITAVTVAFNFIDGLDGLAAGITAIASSAMAIAAAIHRDIEPLVVALALLGSSCGFLVFNFNPASVFMGDCGSLFFGFVLAATGLMIGQAAPGEASSTSPPGGVDGFLLTAFALAVPLADAAVTMLRRGVLQRRSLFAAERGHIHHRLIDRGLSVRRAVGLIWLISAVGALIGLVAGLATGLGAALPLVLGVCVVLGLFHFSGAICFRSFTSAWRRNRLLARADQSYRRCIEDTQLRFRHVTNFEQWWNEVCTAAAKLGLQRFALPLNCRDGTTRVLCWNARDAQEHDLTSDVSPPLMATVPVRQRRIGPPLIATVQVAMEGTLEDATRRLSAFARLLEEHGIARLPTSLISDRPVCSEMLNACRPTAESVQRQQLLLQGQFTWPEAADQPDVEAALIERPHGPRDIAGMLSPAARRVRVGAAIPHDRRANRRQAGDESFQHHASFLKGVE